MSVETKRLEELVKELTPQARLELRDFAEFLWYKQQRELEERLRQDRADALRDQREQYTAPELRPQASDGRLIKETAMTTAVHQSVVVQAGGRIELSDPQLPVGATAEVIVLLNLPLAEAHEETAPPLASFIGAAKGGFATPEDVDRFINGERDAWA
jgi:hypothetical protein